MKLFLFLLLLSLSSLPVLGLSADIDIDSKAQISSTLDQLVLDGLITKSEAESLKGKISGLDPDEASKLGEATELVRVYLNRDSNIEKNEGERGPASVQTVNEKENQNSVPTPMEIPEERYRSIASEVGTILNP